MSLSLAWKDPYPMASGRRDRPLPPSPSLILVASDVSWQMPWAGWVVTQRQGTWGKAHTGIAIYRSHDKPEFGKAPTFVNKAF